MRRTNHTYISIFTVLLTGALTFQSMPAQHILMTGWGSNESNDDYLDLQEAHLEELGYTVTRSDTFPDSIEGVDILFLMGGSSRDVPEAIVDAFVEAGGSLLLFEDVVESGSFDGTADSNPVSACSGWDSRTNVTVVDTDHDLCQGLDETIGFSGYSTNPAMKSGAHVLIRWDDQAVFAAAYSWGAGKVIYLNWLNTWYYNYWGSQPGNGRTFMENAMDWLCPVAVGIEDDHPAGVREFALNPNYPNPFNPVTMIRFDLAKEAFVSLSVCDISGKEVAVLLSESVSAGRHQVPWNAGGLPSGVYFIRFETEYYSQMEKCVLLK